MSKPAGPTAISMTADLLNNAFRSAPAEPPPQPSTPPAPAATEPSAAPPPVDSPAAPVQEPKPFDPASVASRYTQPAPEPVAQPAAPEIPPEPPAADPAQPVDPKAKFSWAQLRTEHKAYKTQVDKLSQELEAERAAAKQRAEEQAQVAAALEAAKRREQELVEKVGRLSLAESPEFQKKYDLRTAEIKTRLGGALTRYAGIPEAEAPAVAERLLAANAKELPDLLADMNPSVAGMVLNITSEAAAVDEARKQELENWRQTGAAAAFLDARQSVVEQAESRRRMSDEAVKAAKALGNPVFASSDPKTAEVAEALAGEFHGFVQTATEDQLIKAAAEGFTAPYLYAALEQLQQEVFTLREAVAGRRRASLPPLFPASSAPAPAAAPAAPPPNVSPARPAEDARGYALSAAADAIAGLGFPVNR